LSPSQLIWLAKSEIGLRPQRAPESVAPIAAAPTAAVVPAAAATTAAAAAVATAAVCIIWIWICSCYST